MYCYFIICVLNITFHLQSKSSWYYPFHLCTIHFLGKILAKYSFMQQIVVSQIFNIQWYFRKHLNYRLFPYENAQLILIRIWGLINKTNVKTLSPFIPFSSLLFLVPSPFLLSPFKGDHVHKLLKWRYTCDIQGNTNGNSSAKANVL